MFNLIVSGAGWKPNRGTIQRDRVLEYTPDFLAEQFQPGGKLNIDTVCKLPTVFMPENSSDSEVAHVGTILQIREAGRDYELTYSWESAIPPIPNGQLEFLASELNINDWEFSRTHWAVKDADIYRALLLTSNSRPTPKLFKLSDEPVDGKLVSVMMPFNAAFDDVYHTIIGAVRELRRTCKRADDIWKNEQIIQDVVHLICTSRVVICDLSGRNSNVFYETGIAHVLGKDVILITQSKDDVPFDLRHLRFIPYLNNGEGLQQLAEQLKSRIVSLLNL